VGFFGLFLKKMTIKKVTKKYFYDIFNLLKTSAPTLSPDRVTLTLNEFYMTTFGESPPVTEFGALYYHTVIILVCRELSYDPTIPTLDDTTLMIKTIQQEAKKCRETFEMWRDVLVGR